MPELPEVETLRRILHPYVVGKRIENFDLGWPRTIEPCTHDELANLILGRNISGTRRRGKLMVFDLDDGGALTVHLRMTGELLFRPDASVPREVTREPYLRAVFTMSGGAELCFYDVRKFGRIGYLPADLANTPDPRLGVEPLEAQFTIEALQSLLTRRRSMKPLLLDQRVIAGLGNIYVDEILFRAGIHPRQDSSLLDRTSIERLHHAISTVLTEAIEHQGTTFRDYRSGLGASGTNQNRLRVYGRRDGTPCDVCGTALRRVVIAQRGTVLCPQCQPIMTTDTRNQSAGR